MFKVMLQQYPVIFYLPIMLTEFGTHNTEKEAWKEAFNLAELNYKDELQCIELYDTRMRHRAVYFYDRYNNAGELIAKAGWYNPRKPYCKIDVNNPEWV